MAVLNDKVGQSGQMLSSVEAKILFTVPESAVDGEMNIIRPTSATKIFIAFGYKASANNFDILLQDGQATYYSNHIIRGPAWAISDTDGCLIHTFCPFQRKD